MKNKQSQSGSGHLIIVILIIVALIGAMGFVYWRNFMQVPASDISKDDTIKTTSDADTVKTLTISEWGITGKYFGKYTLTYTTPDPGNFITFSTKGYPKNCDIRMSGGPNPSYVMYSANEVLVPGDGSTALQKYNNQEKGIYKIGEKYFDVGYRMANCFGMDASSDAIRRAVEAEVKIFWLTAEQQ